MTDPVDDDDDPDGAYWARTSDLRRGCVYAHSSVTVGRVRPTLRLHAIRTLRAGTYRMTLTVIRRGRRIQTVQFVTLR